MIQNVGKYQFLFVLNETILYMKCLPHAVRGTIEIPTLFIQNMISSFGATSQITLNCEGRLKNELMNHTYRHAFHDNSEVVNPYAYQSQMTERYIQNRLKPKYSWQTKISVTLALTWLG